MMPITQSPPMANLFFAMRVRASFHREEPCGIVDGFSAMILVGSSGQAHAGIQKTGEQVGEEVHDDNEEAKEEGKPQEKKFVPGCGRIDEVLTHAGNLEDRLYDKGTADQGGEGRTQVRYCGQETSP